MRMFLKTIPAAVSNFLESVSLDNAFSAIMIPVLWLLILVAFLFLYLLRIVFLWPLIFFTATTAVIIILIPVLTLINPLFTPDVLTHGMMRVFHQLPSVWLALILLSLTADMLLFLHREHSREFAGVRDRIFRRGIIQAGERSGRGGDLTDKQRR
ncbi:hypothetical protein HA42_04740 [Pantoea deleyi]|uniref:Uncharacterized protein n=1 Tax=Pantoea deleyi TaxID=470932 RepID=A0A506QTC5_9GAMM|nr:hypothetical protein [Pantoea deleyi]ORM84297.1 hypothetical protein HA42_04740 [Pantoea deleyi]TPV49613.1 hypothetical protein FJW01_00640 [Pantoea deleyi]